MKNILISGFSSGIGKSIFEFLNTSGRHVYTVGRQAPEDGRHFYAVNFEQPIYSQIRNYNLPAEIDLLMLCAGSDKGGRTEFLDQNFDVWESTLNVNFVRQLEFVYHVLPRVLHSEKKCIAFVSSNNIDEPPRGCAAYTSAKAAFAAAMKTVFLEYQRQGLQMIELRPKLVRTNFALNRTGSEQKAREFYQGFKTVLEPGDVTNRLIRELQGPDGGYRLIRI